MAINLCTLIAKSARALFFCGGVFVGVGGAGAVELRLGVKGLPPNLGNPYVSAGPAADTVLSAIFDGLTRLDSNGNLEPALALSWENIGETSWRFKLRRDAAFSNGEPFNAEAVAAAIAWLQSSEGKQFLAAQHVRGVARVEIENTHTVVIHTERPDAILPNRLSAVSVVAPDAWRRLGAAAFAVTPAGTGAFVVSDWGGVDRSN